MKTRMRVKCNTYLLSNYCEQTEEQMSSAAEHTRYEKQKVREKKKEGAHKIGRAGRQVRIKEKKGKISHINKRWKSRFIHIH